MTRQGGSGRIGRKGKGGPKTIEGKAVSSRNALRHGLTTVKRSNPAYASTIVELAIHMCGTDDDPHLYAKALEIAECDVLIGRLYEYGSALIERLVDPDSLPTEESKVECKRRSEFGQWQCDIQPQVMAVHPGPSGPVDDEKTKTFNRWIKKFFYTGEDRDGYSAFVVALPDLMRLDRYEARVWSRRRRAFLEFLAIKTRQRLS